MTLTTSIVDPLGPEGAVASALARNVEPFITTVLGYDTVVLSWSAPALGSWLGIQIVRSRSGYPRTPDDGLPVLNYQHPGWNEENSFTATGLTGGYHYFSLFLKDAFGWQRVSTQDALVPYDYSSTDLMWDALPEYYRVVRDNTADISKVNVRINPSIYSGTSGGDEPNLLLSAYISLFGWGMDLLRTEVEYLSHGYDPTVVHTSRLRLLSQQFGHEPETAVPAHVNRTIVRNLATLYRNRGTLAGIHDTLSAVSGWDVEVTLGYNKLLSEQQSAFTTPTVTNWSPTVKYSTNSMVKYADYVYIALQDNLLGIGTAPSGSQSSNAYWSWLSYPRPSVPSANRADTGDVATWQVRTSASAGAGVQGLTENVVGALNITGSARQETAMRVGSTASGLTFLDVVSVPTTYTPAKPARAAILEAGIPIPKPVKWRSDRTYLAGEYAVYKGAAYEALNTSKGIPPTSTADWVRVGADDRVQFVSSSYAHGPFSGTPGTGAKLITPRAYSYLADGSLYQTLEYVAGQFYPVFDAFVDDSGSLDGTRTLATGQVWTSDGSGTWSVSRDDNGGRVAPAASGRTVRYVNGPTWTTFNVAVTWTADPGTTRLMGLVFRHVDASGYWIATQTGLYKVVGGTRTNPASGALTWTKFNAGERMRVFVDSNTISVYRNNVLLGTATDSFAATATHPGLGTEA